MRAEHDCIEPALHLFSATRHIERIADHATNIAEDVIYLVEGAIVRHQHQVMSWNEVCLWSGSWVRTQDRGEGNGSRENINYRGRKGVGRYP